MITKSEEKILEPLIDVLTEGHLDTIGGYPYDCMWIGDTLVIAGLDGGKDYHRTMLTTHKKSKLLAWARRAHKAKTEWWPDESFETCVYETAPKVARR